MELEVEKQENTVECPTLPGLSPFIMEFGTQEIVLPDEVVNGGYSQEVYSTSFLDTKELHERLQSWSERILFETTYPLGMGVFFITFIDEKSKGEFLKNIPEPFTLSKIVTLKFELFLRHDGKVIEEKVLEEALAKSKIRYTKLTFKPDMANLRFTSLEDYLVPLSKELNIGGNKFFFEPPFKVEPPPKHVIITFFPIRPASQASLNKFIQTKNLPFLLIYIPRLPNGKPKNKLHAILPEDKLNEMQVWGFLLGIQPPLEATIQLASCKKPDLYWKISKNSNQKIQREQIGKQEFHKLRKTRKSKQKEKEDRTHEEKAPKKRDLKGEKK